MKYIDMLAKKETVIIESEKNDAEELLRSWGFKIKLVTKTAFGTQIDFAKRYENEKVEEILKDFDIKIKEKSVFIIK